MDQLRDAMIVRLEDKFPDAHIELWSRDNDQVHYYLKIFTDSFVGLKLLDQQRAVNAALEGFVGEAVHALSMKTGTLNEREN